MEIIVHSQYMGVVGTVSECKCHADIHAWLHTCILPWPQFVVFLSFLVLYVVYTSLRNIVVEVTSFASA